MRFMSGSGLRVRVRVRIGERVRDIVRMRVRVSKSRAKIPHFAIDLDGSKSQSRVARAIDPFSVSNKKKKTTKKKNKWSHLKTRIHWQNRVYIRSG